MNYYLLFFILFVILLSFLICIFLVPFVYKFGLKLGIIDNFEERKIDPQYKVSFGGIAIVFSFYIAVGLGFLFLKLGFLETSFNLYPFILAALFNGILFFLIGLLDDVFSLSPFLRLALQIIVVCIGIGFGFNINIESFQIFYYLDHNYLIKFLNSIFTILFLVGLTNSFNWIDGLDGLASGVSAIVNFGFLFISISTNNIIGAILAASNIGASAGFLKYNSFPSKIIMGDGGSYFLGYMNSIVAILTFTGLDKDGQLLISFNNLIFLLTILFVPIFDMFIVIVKRIKRGKSPFFPDRTHLHHFFYDKGLSHRRTVILIYSLTQWFVFLSTTLKVGTNYNFIFFSSLILFGYLFFIFKKFDYKLLEFKK